MSELVTNKITPGTGSSDTVTLGDSGDTFTIPAGVTLAGSGAALTALPAANLTGTLPAIDGSNLTGVGVTGVAATGSGITVTGSVLETLPLSGTLIQTQCTTNITQVSMVSTTANLVTQAFTKRLSSSVSRLEFTGWTSFGLYTAGNTNQDGTDPRLYVTTTGGGQVGNYFYNSDVPHWSTTHSYNGNHDTFYKSGSFNLTTIEAGSYTYYLTAHGGAHGVYINRPQGSNRIGGISGLRISEVII